MILSGLCTYSVVTIKHIEGWSLKSFRTNKLSEFNYFYSQILDTPVHFFSLFLGTLTNFFGSSYKDSATIICKASNDEVCMDKNGGHWYRMYFCYPIGEAYFFPWMVELFDTYAVDLLATNHQDPKPHSWFLPAKNLSCN